MALTITAVPGARSVSGTIREEFFDVTFDSSYPAGGEVITARDFGLMALYGICAVGGNATANGAKLHFDHANLKLMVAFAPDPAGAGGAATPFVEPTTSLASYTFRVRVTGI